MRNLARIAPILLVLASSSPAEVYRWTDPDGRVHFTSDLNQVPPQHRPDAVQRNLDQADTPAADRLSTYETDGPADPSPRRAAGRAIEATAPGGPVYRIPVQRAGTALVVAGRINGELVVPFLVDTGASDVSVPRWALERLGIDPDASGRTREYMTANGMIEESTLTLRSLEVGGARVDDVPAAVSSTMEIGLLGLSFFNHFSVHVDAANGVLTLVPNDLVATGQILAGRSEAQWRAEYGNLRARLARVDDEARRTNPNQSSKLGDLDDARRELLRQLEILEAEADQARVPLPWRE
jgi:clan AA aspartic protease (TIGR02281 family)